MTNIERRSRGYVADAARSCTTAARIPINDPKHWRERHVPESAEGSVSSRLIANHMFHRLPPLDAESGIGTVLTATAVLCYGS